MKVHDVEQRSAAWYALRAGKPTSSEFSKIITSNGKPSKSASDYALMLAAELFAGKPIDAWEGNAWTKRGLAMEAAAIALYEFAFDIQISPVGFVTDDAEEIGCSPDGFVANDGVVELKCLKAKNHIKAILHHRKHGYCLPSYVQQAQGQMMICGRAWCDTVFYHPEFPLLVIRQEPDATLWAALLTQIPPLLKERDEVLRALLEHANQKKKKAA